MEFDPMDSTMPATSEVAADFREWVQRNRVEAIDPSNARVRRWFIPGSELKHYLDERMIKTLLRSYALPEYEARTIQSHYLAVFATLIIIHRGRYIEHFISRYYLVDHRLPFVADEELPYECKFFFGEFSRARWHFCAVPLHEDHLTRKRLIDEQIIPILSCETLKVGVDSSTYIIEIHPEYNQLFVYKDKYGMPATNRFVLKVSAADNERHHEYELEAYKTMIYYSQDGKLPNMAHFYGSWHQHERYNMLLEYVEGGTLEEYYKANQPPTRVEDILKFWGHLLDVVKPVMLIHKLVCPQDYHKYMQGIHHDIKAGNILVSYTGSSPYDVTFKLADLGLSDFAFQPQRDREPRRRDKSGAQTYRAPECVRDENDHASRRKIIEAHPSKDIWSLGCLLSEAVAWATWGNEGLEQYQKNRIAEIAELSSLRDTAYMSCFHDGKGMLNAVRRLHVRARKEHRRNDYVIREILPLIERMLDAAESRPDANDIYNFTQGALRTARKYLETDSSGISETYYPKIFRLQPPKLPPELPLEFSPEEASDPTESSSMKRYPEANLKPPTPPSLSISGLGLSMPNASGHSRYFEEFHEATLGRGKKGRINPGSSPRSIPFISDPAPTSSESQWNPSKPRRHSATVHRPAMKQKDDYRNTVVPPRFPVPRPQSPESREKLPYATIEVVEDWIRRKKRNAATPPLDGHEHLSILNKRDQIFLIDNSSSMRRYWKEVERTFSVLAYLVKRMDPDGIELYFTKADGRKTARSKDRNKLLALFKSMAATGQTDIGFALGKIFRAYEAKLAKEKGSFLSRLVKDRWGVNIYVLTDGVWEEGESWRDSMVEHIKVLSSKGMELGQVGIEFIQFGNNEQGIQRLRTLDDRLPEHGIPRGMIDFEHSAGNVYKMLLGSVHPSWDEISFSKSTVEREFTKSDSGYASGPRGISNVSYTIAQPTLIGIEEASDTGKQVGLVCSVEDANPPNMGLYDKDTAYSPSETPSLPPLRSKVYIDDLASQLFKAVSSQKPDLETLNRISQEFPDLLRAFSLRIGYRAAPTQCHIAYFLHKYRGHVQQSFENMFPLETASPEADVLESLDTQQFNVGRYMERLDEAVDPPHEDSEYQDSPPFTADQASPARTAHNGETEDDIEPPEPDPYRDSVLDSPAFHWLVTTLLTEINLTRQTADAMRSIRTQILSALPSSHDVSRKNSSREYKARFEIDWDPLSFVTNQKYGESPDQAIERSITLTGSPEDAQALTTEQYLIQTWPASGAELMGLIAETMRNPDHHASGTLPDGTELQTRTDGGKFTVHAVGIGDSLAEVAQQFAWLGAALRPSPFESGIALCSPTIRSPLLENINPRGKTSDSTPFAEISFIVEFDVQKPLDATQRGPGHCWHSMFRNPVMVKGYPIMSKHKSDAGLEISLNVMSELTESKYANKFDGKTFIKGFSTMLIATEVSKDLILWHYYFNTAGERISYLDHDLQTTEAISLQQLGSARHVVGWCHECESYAGTDNVAYDDIGSVYLPEPHADCILEKISISGGKLISGGASFALAVHHIPPHLIRDSYLGKLSWIATRFVVFWDEMKKRGWLVNGTSALLHLVRASIRHHSNSDFSALVTFDSSKIKTPIGFKPNYASQVLSDPENLLVEVMLDKIEKVDEADLERDANGNLASTNWKPKIKRTYKLFSHIVEEHYRHLEQIMDYQVQAGGRNGFKTKLRVRKHLEGWDFMELATGHDPSPRVATLEALGWGWVDFVRSIEAITLIGSGFGEMIRPTEFDRMCPNWGTLPEQRYYLATTFFDLEKIIKTKRFGGSLQLPIKPVRGLVWHSPQEAVAPCPCRSAPGPQEYRAVCRHHHDPVQVFYPTALGSVLRIRGPDKLHTAGAIVFGHNISCYLRWMEKGDELDVTTVNADSSTSSDPASLLFASLGSQSHESGSTITRDSSALASEIASTPIGSASGSAARDASTTSESGLHTLNPPAQVPIGGTPMGRIQKTSVDEVGSSLLRKMRQKLKRPKQHT